MVGLVTKGTMKDLSPPQILFLFSIAGLLIIITILKAQKKNSLASLIKNANRNYLYIAIINFSSFCVFFKALKLIDITVITAIGYLTPIISGLLAIFILREKISSKITISLTISILGAFIVMKPIVTNSLGALGILCALGSAVGWALHAFFLKKQAMVHWLEQSFIILSIVIPISFPFAIMTWQPLTPRHIMFLAVLGMIYTLDRMFVTTQPCVGFLPQCSQCRVKP